MTTTHAGRSQQRRRWMRSSGCLLPGNQAPPAGESGASCGGVQSRPCMPTKGSIAQTGSASAPIVRPQVNNRSESGGVHWTVMPCSVVLPCWSTPLVRRPALRWRIAVTGNRRRDPAEAEAIKDKGHVLRDRFPKDRPRKREHDHPGDDEAPTVDPVGSEYRPDRQIAG